jgi:hypothetical protein
MDRISIYSVVIFYSIENKLMDDRADALYKLLKGRIDWNNLVPTCLEAGRELEQMTTLKGPEKLDLLQHVLRKALQESNLPRDRKERLAGFIANVVPMIAQAMILASKVPIKSIQSSCCWKK